MGCPPSISNPKRQKAVAFTKDTWFDYYAGFSSRFVADAIRHLNLPTNARVLDPWNGSGTTTATARELGVTSVGVDINPVMVVVARAKLLSKGVSDSLLPLADEILEKALESSCCDCCNDPLTAWLAPTSAAAVRAIADAIASVLTPHQTSRRFYCPQMLPDISDLAAFYLVALFRTVRDVVRPFRSTNPTWIKLPRTFRHRLRPDAQYIQAAFRTHVAVMAGAVTHQEAPPAADIHLGTSCSLPRSVHGISAVISSPPYCTRIDYAVATKPELAVLGCPLSTEFTTLRKRLIGGPVIDGTRHRPLQSW
jgi:hypothetical protein